jgi:hypothetical protein
MTKQSPVRKPVSHSLSLSLSLCMRVCVLVTLLLCQLCLLCCERCNNAEDCCECDLVKITTVHFTAYIPPITTILHTILSPLGFCADGCGGAVGSVVVAGEKTKLLFLSAWCSTVQYCTVQCWTVHKRRGYCRIWSESASSRKQSEKAREFE